MTAASASILATALAAKTGSTTTATINGVDTTVQVARDLTVGAGDVMVVMKFGGQWFAVCRVYPAATTPPADPGPSPPPTRPTVTTGTLVVTPVETRSHRTSGWRMDTTEVIQGQYGGWGNHTGVAFYGTKARSLTGATVTDATVRFRRVTGGAYGARQSTLRLVTQTTRPAGAPTLGASTAGPSIAVGSTTTFDIPVSWAQAMVDGTAGGLAVFDSSGAPYIRYAGRAEWGGAFALTIKWRRS